MNDDNDAAALADTDIMLPALPATPEPEPAAAQDDE
jgi:hypothetical protein